MITSAEQDIATRCMASLIGALADNKAALGRRYGEWAVSAPTLESAVAAAAMAQDELGHARSTYPVLKSLGFEERDETGFGRDRRLALLDSELADWTTMIAANLLVDAALTTFVTSCVNSSVTAMAQRARKILQEEGSHRVHAEAWARRLCRSGDAQAELLIERLATTWEQSSRFPGPDDDPGAVAAVELGMFSLAPGRQRAMVRDWLVALLDGEGRTISLIEPADWSAWDPRTRRWAP